MKSPHILLIEDDEALIHVYTYKFNKLNYQYEVARDGREGIKLGKKVQPDIILCDILMPQKDGISFLRSLRRTKAISHIPVIMLTNISEKKYVELAEKYGASEYVVKSNTSLSELEELINETLKKSETRKNE